MIAKLALLLAALLSGGNALPSANSAALSDRSATEPYAPYSVSCPLKPLARPAITLGVEELAYVTSRELVADVALKQWLQKTTNDTSILNCELPRLAMALSGGGPKAGLASAGAVEAFDSRDSPNGVGGLLQSMTYMSALSGGSLTLAGMMTNDFSKISTLKTNLYDVNSQNPFLLPLVNSKQVQSDVNAKTAAGYPASVIDTYGRAIAYNYIGGPEGGNGITWSNVTTQPSFKSHEAPYPILTLTDADVAHGQCYPNFTGPIWEFAPYDFGSWDTSVHAFYPTKYLGTPTSGPLFGGSCTNGFDNAGFFTGISSDDLPEQGAQCAPNGTEVLTGLAGILNSVIPAHVIPSPFGIVPNPFQGDNLAGIIRNRQNLYMADGGFTGQGIPIFPFLQPARSVDVIFVIDVESGSSQNLTDGSSLYDTYTAAHAMGLTSMPIVPDSATFLAQNLSSRAQFFGCNDPISTTLIYFPDTYETAYSSSDYFLTPAAINTIFQGGIDQATQKNDARWPTCVACGIMHKSFDVMPEVCKDCLQKYCWTG